MNEKINIDVKTLKPFTRFLYTIGELPTSYLISMTYEEQLLWLCNYLEKTVIPALNNNALATKELQDLFIELQQYVNDYFSDLNIQTEINNKLDDMAQGGQLQEIISQYLELQSLLIYDNVASLKEATNLINGSKALTLGYYQPNDLGGATYKIRTKTIDDTPDDAFLIGLNDNTLVAELLIDQEINIRQLGVTGVSGDDYTSLINQALQSEYNVYFPKGTYSVSSYLTILNATNKIIRGDGFDSIIEFDDELIGDYTSYITTSYQEIPENLTIKDLKVDAGTQTIRRYILTISYADGLQLENVELCYGCGYATRLNDCKNIVANNLYIHDCNGAAAESVGGGFYGGNMENVKVTNSRFENIGDHCFYLTGDIATTGTTYAKNIQLANIYMKNVGSDGLTAGGAITIYGDIENVEIDNCIIEDASQGVHISNHGMGVITPRKVTINNCIITNSSSAGVYISGLNEDLVDDITINNCIIDEVDNDGISVRQATNVIIINNVIKNCERLGIELVNTDNSVVNSNILKDNLQQIYVGTRSSTHAINNSISNNNIYLTNAYKEENTDARGLYVDKVATNTYISNNNIKNHPYYNIVVYGNTNTIVMQDNNGSITNSQKNITYGTSAPASYYNRVGDICFNSNPSAGGTIGWVCVTAGDPVGETNGVWKTFGAINS